MPLLRNPYQPFFLDPDAPAPLICVGEYCNPVASGDIIKQEFYQTPCDGSITVDPEFEDSTLGPELVTNGTFTGSAAGWTLESGADGAWTYNANAIEYSGTNPVFSAFQTGLGLITGRTYRVSFDVTVGSGGIDCDLGLGSGLVNVFNNILVTESYSVDVLFTDSDDRISFSAATSGANVLTLDNVSVREVTFADWVPSGAWNLNAGIACKTDPSIGGNLYNGSSDYITNGDYYQVTVDVSSYGGSGSVSVYIDDGTGASATNPQVAITANGQYTYWITAAQTGVIGFAPSASFTGCISNPVVQLLRNDYPFSLIDAVGDVYPLFDYVTYVRNKVLLELDPQSVLGEDYQCFTIQVIDTCLTSGNNLVENPTFAAGFDDWTKNNGAFQYDIIGGELVMKFLPLDEQPTKITNGDFSGGATGWTVGAGWSIAGGQATHTPGSTATLSQTITIDPPAVLPDILRHWWQLIISNWTVGTITVTIGDVTSAAYGVNDTITNLLVPGVGGAVTFAITPSSTFDGDITGIAVHPNTDVWSAAVTLVNVANPAFVDGNYELEFDITARTGSTNISAGAAIQNQPVGVTYYNTLGVHQTTINNYVPGNQRVQIIGVFVVGNIYYPGTITVDDISAVRIEPFDATYTSECMNYQNSFENSKLLTAWCDLDAWGSTFLDSLGFLTSGYKIQIRIICKSYNEDIDAEFNQSRHSNGNAQINYAQAEKFWQFTSDYISGTAATIIKMMPLCDHFTIGDSDMDGKEYLMQAEDATIRWRTDGDYGMAPIVITLRKKTGGMKFNRHT